VAGAAYEKGLEDFFELVLQNCAQHVDAKALGALVGQINTERADRELAAWRRLEACLGFDADQAPKAVVKRLLGRERQLGADAVEEAAVAAPGSNSPAVLEEVYQAARSSAVKVRFDDVLASKSPPSLRPQAPWEAAEDAANHLRAVLGLHGVITGEVMGDLLQVRWQDIKDASATARRLPYGACARSSPSKTSIALQMEPHIDRKFELARVIGDRLWPGASSFGVISRARTDRQKFQRAFARALLCPIDQLQTVVQFEQPTPTSIRQAAHLFGVRPKVVETVLETRGYLRPYTGIRTFENV
jgi:hypothetical protein